MKIKTICSFVCISLLLFSCGSKKRVVYKESKRTEVKRQPVISKVERTVEIQSKEERKPEVVVPYKERVQNYINTYAKIAKDEMVAYGIPASITLAQGILESGAGNGDLTRRANNHFGIKCHDWTGDRVYHDDDRLQECFRKYTYASESFRDHSEFLANRSRYAGLFKLRKEDYKGWAKGLKAAGYATDKKYPDKLISIIERYDLAEYDREVLGIEIEQPVIETAVVVESANIVNTASNTPSNPTNSISQTAEEGHLVNKGDTLYSISKKYKITVDQLKTYNNLTNNTIKVGQILRVRKTDVDQEPDEEFEDF